MICINVLSRQVEEMIEQMETADENGPEKTSEPALKQKHLNSKAENDKNAAWVLRNGEIPVHPREKDDS